MTVLFAVVLFFLAAAAAARSSWSPCGLSMLSSITPIGEAGRGHRYASTARWFVVGALVGGSALGGVAAGGAALVRLLIRPAAGAGSAGLFGEHATPTLFAASALACLVAAALDCGVFGDVIPVIRRQVNERWLDQFRSWVYGAGFGFQIGAGFATYVMTAAVPALVVVSMLSASPSLAFAVCAGFGLLRGLTVLLGRSVTDPAALRRVHAGLDRWEAPVRLGVVVVTLGSAAILGAAIGLVACIAITVAAAGVVLTSSLRRRLSALG
jgi:hypothetical protein